MRHDDDDDGDGCVNCAFCEDCTNCLGCINCTDCTDCKECSSSADCVGCTGLRMGRGLTGVHAWESLSADTQGAIVSLVLVGRDRVATDVWGKEMLRQHQCLPNVMTQWAKFEEIRRGIR